MKKLILALMSIAVLGGCAEKTTYLSFVVPEGTRFTSRELNSATKRVNIEGSSIRPILLVFPIGVPSFQSALNEALEEGRGDVMTNVAVTSEIKWFGLFGYNKIAVKGEVVNTHK